MARKPYPSDVTDEEWAFVAPYLTLMREDVPQREHTLREVFNGLRYFVRGGQAWRMLPNDLPPWDVVYGQTRRWMDAGVFDAMTQDLRRILRVLGGRHAEPTAAVFDSRTLQSTPESGTRARVRRCQAPQGQQDAHGRRHARAPARPARDGGRRAGPTAGGEAGRGRGGGDGRRGRVGVRRPGLHRRAAGRGREEERHRAVGREAAAGQTRVRAAPAAVGRRTQLRLAGPLPAAGPRLRAIGPPVARAPPRRVRLRHAAPTDVVGYLECTTRSRQTPA